MEFLQRLRNILYHVLINQTLIHTKIEYKKPKETLIAGKGKKIVQAFFTDERSSISQRNFFAVIQFFCDYTFAKLTKI